MAETEEFPQVYFDPNAEYADRKTISMGQKSAKLPVMQASGYFDTRSIGLPENMAGDLYLSQADNLVQQSEMSKALKPIPQAQAFGQISYMPHVSGKNVVEWPGLDPRSLKRITDENYAAQMIAQMRVNDIQKYSRLSTHPWKPGWKIELVDGNRNPTRSEKNEIEDAKNFLLACNSEYDPQDVIMRERAGLTSFKDFLVQTVYNSIRFDGIATYTVRDSVGQVTQFGALSSYLMRRCTDAGYDGDPSLFMVMCDDTGTPQWKFTREQLIWTVRNLRTDPNVFGYGWSEAQMAAQIIIAFQNAIQINSDTFDKNAIPNAILLLKGDFWTQKQIDLLARAWHNLKTGVSKAWAFPAVNVPQDGEMSLMDLKDIKGTELIYRDFVNLIGSLLCALYGFPPSRLGFHPSGHTKDNEPQAGSNTAISGDDDPGLPALLITIEQHVNQLIQSRWPNLQFTFNGKLPKEDARQYEAHMQAVTLREKRALSDLPTMSDLAKSVDLPTEFKDAGPVIQLVNAMMDYCPNDSNQIGAFTAMVSIALKSILGVEDGNAGDETDKGAKTGEKKDPVKSEAHGGLSGVRRNSAAEKGKVVA